MKETLDHNTNEYLSGDFGKSKNISFLGQKTDRQCLLDYFKYTLQDEIPCAKYMSDYDQCQHYRAVVSTQNRNVLLLPK